MLRAPTPCLTTGSSPRGRGKRERLLFQIVVHRLIPARAGKTVSGAIGQKPPLGSSPRGRGKPPASAGAVHVLGLIPARAGKTQRARRGKQPRAAHPRAGGENGARGSQNAVAWGSSPRGRGKPRRVFRRIRRPRLIPARAGKTRWTPAPGTGSRAHPRAGGENVPLIVARLV